MLPGAEKEAQLLTDYKEGSTFQEVPEGILQKKE